MRGRSSVIDVVTFIAAAWAAPVSAQILPPFDMPAPPPKSFGQLRSGVLTLTPTVNLLNVGIDTNALDLTNDQQVPADFTISLQPQLETRFAAPSLDIRVLARVGLVYYQEQVGERAVNPSIRLSVERRVSPRLSFYTSDTVDFSRDRSGFEVDKRVLRLFDGEVLGGRLRLSRMQFDLQGSHSSTIYGSADYFGVDLSQTLNRISYAAGLTAGYRLTPYTTVLTNVSLGTERFPNASDRNVRWTRESAGLRFSPRAVVKGDFQIGYLSARPSSSEAPPFSGLTPAAGLSYTFRDTTSFAIAVRRDIDYSFSPNQPYFVYNLYEGTVRQALFHRFDIGLTLSQTRLKYRSFVGQAFDPNLPNESDQVLRDSAGSFGLVVHRDTRVAVYVERWRRVGGIEPYTTTRVGLLFTRGPASGSPSGVFLNGPLR